MSLEEFKPSVTRKAKEAENRARGAANSEWTHRLARAGFAAKGIVYIIIGGLAALAAFGVGGGTTDRKGALQTVYDQPFGKFLLIIIAIGLVGYALWKFIEAAMDTENKGTEPKGLIIRGSYAVIGVSYTLLAIAALQLSLGAGNAGQSSDATTQDWTAKLLDAPFGPFLVIVVGAIVIGIGVYQLYKAFTAKFKEKLDLSKLSPTQQNWTVGFGRFGYAARGVIFGLIGLFLIIAALQQNPGEAKGLGGTLQKLQEQPYGPYLLGAVAIGLVAYGIFSLIEAFCRRLGVA